MATVLCESTVLSYLHNRMSNFKKISNISPVKYDLEVLRIKDYSSLIETPLRTMSGKKNTLCPFHEEKTASFFIYPDNSFYCFGCGQGGNAIDFVIRKLGCSFREACDTLESL